jgi:CheY-like chemotaxis protein
MGRPHRILIVDDDRDTLSNLSDILSDIGYHTETASDGYLALEKIGTQTPQQESPFDLCLLDFRMPDMDGAELMIRMKSIAPRLRAIMVTAYAGEDGVHRAQAAGTWKVLRKPVDIKALLSMIDEAVSLAD